MGTLRVVAGRLYEWQESVEFDAPAQPNLRHRGQRRSSPARTALFLAALVAIVTVAALLLNHSAQLGLAQVEAELAETLTVESGYTSRSTGRDSQINPWKLRGNLWENEAFSVEAAALRRFSVFGGI